MTRDTAQVSQVTSTPNLGPLSEQRLATSAVLSLLSIHVRLRFVEKKHCLLDLNANLEDIFFFPYFFCLF